MIVFLNDRFVAEEKAFISIHDRGFLYGDGLFETVRVYGREPFLWEDHAARFERGCRVLRVSCPFSPGEIRMILRELVSRNGLDEALVRFTISRGCGGRGYSPREAEQPTFLMVPFAAPALPESYRAILSRIRLAEHDLLADFKHLNKLHQVAARAEADDAGANEALLMNAQDHVIEGTATNLFWVKEGVVGTPPLRGILAGTTRAHVLRLCAKLRIPVVETGVRPEELKRADGVFVTSSAAEIMELSHLDATELRRSPLAAKLKRAYRTP